MLVTVLATAEVEGVAEGEEHSGQEGEGDGEEVEEEVFEEGEEVEMLFGLVRVEGEAFENAGDGDCDEGG